jgi:hypothetical protein
MVDFALNGSISVKQAAVCGLSATVTSSTVLQSTLTVMSSVRFGSNAVIAGHV